MDALKRQTRGEGSKLWTCGLQQPPLLLAPRTRCVILRRDDLEIVDPAKGIEACAEPEPEDLGALREQERPADARDAKGGDRDAAGALLKRAESGDASACGARPWREKKGAGGRGGNGGVCSRVTRWAGARKRRIRTGGGGACFYGFESTIAKTTVNIRANSTR